MTTRRLLRRRPKGEALRAVPLGVLVVFHLVRISYVFASFQEPVLVRFSIKLADSVNFLPQGACFEGLVGFAQLVSQSISGRGKGLEKEHAKMFQALFQGPCPSP